MWKQVYNFQIAFCVIALINAGAQAGISYVVNKVEVERGELDL